MAGAPGEEKNRADLRGLPPPGLRGGLPLDRGVPRPAGDEGVLLVEAPDEFIVGAGDRRAAAGGWSESLGSQGKETLTFLDDDIARFMEEAMARRNQGPEDRGTAGNYERAFRVLGRYMDEQKPRDTFFFEQDGAFVVRLLMATPQGSRHVLAEFTREDIDEMVARAPALRDQASGSGAAASTGA